MAFKVVKVIRLNDQVSLIDMDGIPISGLAGVNIDSASEGDFFIFRCGSWVHESVPGAVSSTVNNLSSIGDVGILTPSAGDILVWDGSSWSATALAYPTATIANLSSITDVGALTLSAGDILIWDGSTWSATALTIGVTATVEYLSSVGNVLTDSASDGDVLTWIATASQWGPLANPVGGSATVNNLSSIVDVTIAAPSGGDVLTWDDSASVWTNRAASMTAPLVMYVTHQYNAFGHENQAYDAPLGVFYNIGPLVAIDSTGDLVYT